MGFRKALWWVFSLAILCLVGSFFAQYVLNKNPCVLCIAQRVAVIAVAIVALICALCPNRSCIERVISSILVSLVSLGGLWVSIYQIYIQHLPEMEQPSCGAPWSYRLRDAPLFKLYEPIIRGTGNCGEVQTFLYIPLQVWSLLFFSAVLIWVWVWFWRSSCLSKKKLL